METFVLLATLLVFSDISGSAAFSVSGFSNRCNRFLKRRCNSMTCFQLYDPVCASDGVTYTNKCYLSIANCRRGNVGEPLTVVFEGKCSEDQATNDDNCNEFQVCIEIYDPVCGSDKKTYGNSCKLSQANCQRAKGARVISEISKGECRTPSSRCDEIGCTKDYRPVCGSDGTSYNNACLLSVANCRAKENNETPITQTYVGECQCSHACILIYDPVCGTDGKTYSNSCFLGIANCRSRQVGGQGVSQAHKLACGSTS